MKTKEITIGPWPFIVVPVGLFLVFKNHQLAVTVAQVAGVLLAVYVLARFAAWCFLPQRRLTINRNRYLRYRLRLSLHPGRGHATVFALAWRFSRMRMFARSSRIRPDMSAWKRWRTPDAYSSLAGRAHYRFPVRLDMQVHQVLLSVPRTGKTGALATRIIHHPGSVVATSSQPDLFRLTSGSRSRLGKVHVFNPQALGDIESTFRWNILGGCDDPATAVRRADALISAVPAGGADGGDWFKSKASDAMRAMLVAGAVSGEDFRAVSRWILTGSVAEPAAILEGAGYAHLAATMRELAGRAERTASTILMFLSRAVQFCVDESLLLSVLPGEGDGLDLEALVRNKETLYLIAGAVGNDTPLAGLYSALVAEVHHAALQVAASTPGGRLVPPALYALDELCQVVPGIPAARWAADAGGRGISMVLVAHGIAQLEERYGRPGARTIMDCCAAKVVFGGTSDTDTLQMLERLCGQVALREHGHDSHARHPVMAAEMIRELPDGFALLVAANSPPVIVRPRLAWRDRTYRGLARGGLAVAHLAPAAPPRPVR
jgi:type IV secretion system protein VirD4